MIQSDVIDSLLHAPGSEVVAEQLVEWADTTRAEIVRGDMTIGILTPETVAKIPVAYETAAAHGKLTAWLKLARWQARPEFGAANMAAADKALTKALEGHVPGAEMEFVKLIWFYKRDSATNDEQLRAYQMVSAICDVNENDPEAQYLRGLLTSHGFGTAASPEQAFKMLQTAANLGNIDAMFELSIYFAKGTGVAQDTTASLKILQSAAEGGHSRAMYNLGAYFASGKLLPKSIPEAINWYEQAASAGNPSALVGLAAIYATGDGIEANVEYARECLEQADYLGLDVSNARSILGL
jgi:uncharacterized protein